MNPERPEYSTIEKTAVSEITVKKSRFIGQLFHCSGFDEAQDIIASVRKKYYDASHGCTAMIFGDNRELMRCSDAGEPQGTAGVPMLDVLKGSGLTYILAIVTRYFGGTLLGTGGLVRAYSSSVKETLSVCETVTFMPVITYSLEVPFRLWGKADAYIKQNGILCDTEYRDVVALTLRMKKEQEQSFIRDIAEISAGKMIPVKGEPEYIKINNGIYRGKL